MPTDNQDQLSAEDLAVLHETQKHLQDAGDPRAAKLGQYLAAQTQQAPEKPGLLSRVGSAIWKTTPMGIAQDALTSTAETAQRKVQSNEQENLQAAAQGRPLPHGSASNFAYRAAGSAANMGAGMVSPKGIATGAALAVAPEIAGPAMVAHGLYTGGKNTRAALQGNPDAVEQALGGYSEAAMGGAVAGTAIRGGIGNTNTAAAGRATLQAGKTVAGKLLPALIDPEPTVLMTKAIKPTNSKADWDTHIARAMPNLKRAEAQIGKPVENLDDALQAVTVAKQGVWKQYQAKLGPASDIGAVIDGNEVADAMLRSVDRRTAVQNPGLVKQISDVANTYRRPLSVDEAEEFLQSANNDLHNYYAKNKVGQRVALGDPEKAYTVAEAQALRSGLYRQLDEISGPGAADLKKQYGALSTVEEEMLRRKNVAARQQPQSLSEQLSTVRGMGKIAKGVITASPGDIFEGAENITTAKYLKERNSTDAMIRRAFAATPVPEIPIAAPPRPIAGLLNRGPMFTPAPETPDGSGITRGYRPDIQPLAENRQLPPAGQTTGPQTVSGPSQYPIQVKGVPSKRTFTVSAPAERAPVEPVKATRGAPPPKVATRFPADVITEAENEMRAFADMHGALPRPGRYFVEYGEGEAPLTQNQDFRHGERSGGRWYGVSATRPSMEQQFPWFADRKLDSTKVKNAIAKGSGADYERIVGKIAEGIQKERETARPVIEEHAPRLLDLSEKVRTIDPSLSQTLRDLAQGHVSMGVQRLKTYLHEVMSDAESASEFSKAIDDAADEARGEAGIKKTSDDVD
jgi:hypothetical protein